MSTLEALNAISEAIQAHAKLPEIERSLKEAREAHDFALLELEEARAEIEKLKSELYTIKSDLAYANGTIIDRNQTIDELTSRNAQLDASLSDITTLYNNSQHTITERNLQIDSLHFTVNSLSERLAESKSVTTRLTDTLKSIGASIVSAVAEPEVSNPSTFRNPVAMPDTAGPELDSANNPEPMPVMVEPSRQDMVSADAVGSSNVADGCFPYRYR